MIPHYLYRFLCVYTSALCLFWWWELAYSQYGKSTNRSVGLRVYLLSTVANLVTALLVRPLVLSLDTPADNDLFWLKVDGWMYLGFGLLKAATHVAACFEAATNWLKRERILICIATCFGLTSSASGMFLVFFRQRIITLFQTYLYGSSFLHLFMVLLTIAPGALRYLGQDDWLKKAPTRAPIVMSMLRWTALLHMLTAGLHGTPAYRFLELPLAAAVLAVYGVSFLRWARA